MASDQGQCQALQLSDDQRCQKEATHANGLFCGFHSKQVFALYKGYKRRNALLDTLDSEAPEYLKNAREPLANDNFEAIDDEKTLREVHSHLFDKYVLLGNVIDARKLHHKHFYSLNVDYGHQAYIDKLISQRHIVLKAMQRAEKRTTQVLYQKEKWFAWVREVQEEEEANDEKEQKKVKQEAALFKRHVKKLEGRLAKVRQKEEQKRQDAYLDDAYRERMAMAAEEDDEAWDPIEDMHHLKRSRYIDLIKHFLWLNTVEEGEEELPPLEEIPTLEPSPPPEPETPPKKTKKKAKAKAAKAGRSSVQPSGETHTGQGRLIAALREGHYPIPGAELPEPDRNNIETEEEMRNRLSHGVKKNYDNVWGFQIVGTLENPYETHEKTAPMTNDEIESTVSDIRQIKHLLFCRLLLGQASMLPAALRANSVEEFLNDPQVAESDLRDLCLKVEEPTLQDIRDACADFARGDEAEEGEDADEAEEEDEDDETFEELLNGDTRYKDLHTEDWLFEKFLGQLEKKKPSKKKKKKKQKSKKKTKVTVCGKSIWNHASEKAMSRDGWLQFSVMAKDCDLKHAIQLCRNWNEFSDLNLLTLWQYFPASNWVSWGNNRLIQQLQELGFFPYFVDLEAQQHSRYNQVGGRSSNRRQHDIVETRNIIVGHMKRNDPITRRFLQYLLMRTGELLIMVRDGKTGRVITAPPEEQLWTYRMKQGLGRASRNEWRNVLEVGPLYFDMTDMLREWRFGFDDYYDVFIWDFVPCQSSLDMYNVVITELRNAWRIKHPRDVYQHMKPLLTTMTREKDTMRTRLIKPDEKVESLWDTIMDERSEFRLYDIQGHSVKCRTGAELDRSPYMFYNDVNVLEDEILFPDELVSNKKNVPFREIRNGVSRIEDGVLPSTVRHLEKGMEALAKGKDPMKALEDVKDRDDNSIWSIPKVWETGLKQARKETLSDARRSLLKRTGLSTTQKSMSIDQRLNMSDPMETMERDRSFGFKDSFHAGDLEPGSNENWDQVQERINAMLATPHAGPTDWVWFLAEILDWLDLRADYKDYTHDPSFPWPHGFIIQDLVKAFASVAMFFPEAEAATLVTQFIKSKQCDNFRNTLLFNPKERSKTLPDRRSRTSYKFRDPAFWTEWNEFLKTKSFYADVYPFDWSLAIRPIVARLYVAGVIAPAYLQNDSQVVLGMATAKTEPHRPDKLDLFINYEDRYGNFPMVFPPSFVHPSKWPHVLPTAESFAEKNKGARFALIRLWSAPHFYPLMVGLGNRQNTSFLDSMGRSWEWKFVPKDMVGSEYSAHHTTERRLQLLQKQFKGHVMNRADLILVMGKDADELLKFCTAVTFAIQTKPWLREIDLWKSFINVDLEFLQGLDPYWLD
ncbi:hypothetical protein NCS55_00877700 [Fusarium keratoplasticum]|nr:hypothetical protein NCS55_00877700 [Fusarium keratoplasticum]